MAYLIGAAIIIGFGLVCKWSVNYFASYMADIDSFHGRMDNGTFGKGKYFENWAAVK